MQHLWHTKADRIGPPAQMAHIWHTNGTEMAHRIILFNYKFAAKKHYFIHKLKQHIMKTRIFLMMLLAIASVGAKADEVRCILPWGADEPWQMKYVLQSGGSYTEPENDAAGLAWTQLGYDDSQWETLTGPIGSGDDTWLCYNLRRTFTLDQVEEKGYVFAINVDDGGKVFINNQFVLESDANHPVEYFHLDASLFREGENQLAILFSKSFEPNYLDYALFSGYPAGYETTIDNIVYRINDDGKTVTAKGRAEGYDPSYLRFPETITIGDEDYPVTGTDYSGFQSENLTSVFIPKTMTGEIGFGGARNIDYIEVDPENPVYDSRNDCNCIIRTATNEVVRASNKGIIPPSCTAVNLAAFGNCRHMFIPKHITSISNPWDANVETIAVEEGNSVYDSRENCNCIIETSNNRLIAAGSKFNIPNSVVSFGPYSLMGRSGVKDFYQEYPPKLTVYWEIRGSEITLKVPEGSIPRYLYQGWGDEFCQITDGTNTYYGCGRIQGDTWFAPHIEAINFTTEQAGEEVTLSVVLNADQPVTAFQFDLYLPEGMEMTFDEDDYENILLSTARTTERKHTLTSQQMPDGAWRVICYSDKNNTFAGNEGEVCAIRVKTSADMANGGHPITLRNITTTYVNGEGKGQIQRDIITTYVNFFTPDFPPLGDANGDKQVNVTDITTVVSHILGNNPTKFIFALADAYPDGTINVTDIAATVDIIMNESEPNQAPRRNARRNARKRTDEEATTASLEVIPFAIAPGEEKDVEVVLNNPDNEFTGLQFDLALPEGISLVSDEDGYFVSLGSRTTSRKHTIEAQQRADGTIRVMAYSNRNSNFSGSEGDVVVLTLKADDNLTAGVYNLQLKGIVLSQANAGEINQVEPADYEGSILSGTLAENPVIKGDITAEAANIISAAVTKDVTHIDLTSATKVAADAEFTTANPNTLILAPAETQNTGKNVVAGDVCANLVLSDASTFATPKTFTASQVSFSTNVNEYKTLTLPFNADVPEGFSASNATSVTGTTVNLESTSTINANSPVLIEGEGTLELKATNAVVNATGDAALTNGMLSGTFKSIPAPVGSYVLQKHSGLTGFYLVADVQPTVGAFRAHLNVTESGVKLYTFGDEATGISLTPALSEEGTTYYYNVSGQRMSRMQRGINIVNGKKIIY